jgi:hypothetical protein
MTTSRRRWRLGLAVAALAALPFLGCGGDEPPPKKEKGEKAEKDPAAAAPAAGAAAPAAAAAPAVKRTVKKKRGKRAAFEVYPRIDERYRRELTEADFMADPSGEERRDPFQSFVVRQGGPRRLASKQVAIQPTDVCTEKNSKAPGFLLRDMRLIGIVLRGTNSFAQFRDKSGFGWIVRRGDCLGKEKAVVQTVGVGSVTLEVIPETPPNSPPPPPQRQDIALYPEDLEPGLATATDDLLPAATP